MRAIPGKMRTDEVYVAAFGSIIFINIGLHASKRGYEVVCRRVRGCGDPRADVCRYLAARVRVYVRSDGTRASARTRLCLGTWVCEQRVCESEAATNGVREIVVPRRRRGGDNG